MKALKSTKYFTRDFLLFYAFSFAFCKCPFVPLHMELIPLSPAALCYLALPCICEEKTVVWWNGRIFGSKVTKVHLRKSAWVRARAQCRKKSKNENIMLAPDRKSSRQEKKSHRKRKMRAIRRQSFFSPYFSSTCRCCFQVTSSMLICLAMA